MSQYDKRASLLQNRVMFEEMDRDVDYDDSSVRRATVHARQDLILLVAYLSDVNKQLAVVRWIMIINLIMFLFLIYKMIS